MVFVEHLVIFFLTQGEPPYPLHWMALARVLQFVILGLIFWRCRKASSTPTEHCGAPALVDLGRLPRVLRGHHGGGAHRCATGARTI